MPLPESYLSTVFLVEDDLRSFPESFAIVTAYNHRNRLCQEKRNLTADRQLRALLARMRIPHFRVTGASPDLSHAEPGWGIGIRIPAARFLAARFHQLAFWWIENDRLDLLATFGPEQWTLGSFSERVRPR